MATQEHNKPPSYPEMILAAIKALNEKNGSNKTSIFKYIESKYGGDLPAGHSALLSHHLNKMKETGQLVFWKNNYTIFDPNAPPRRGRGRPPKPKDSLPSAGRPSPARPRGRPRKDPNATPMSVEPKSSSGGTGRPRGRPRKMAKPSGGLAATATSANVLKPMATGRPRGRPPKAKVPMSGVAS